MLSLKSVDVSYGAIIALREVSLDVAPGEIVALVGANGAGKSTLLNAVSGLVAVRSGAMTFDGQDLRSVPAHRMVRHGIVQVPEGRQVFKDLTVVENLEMGGITRSAAENADMMERVFALFPRLNDRRSQFAGLMSGGEQQMLAIGRALMARPRLLLLDEPSMGLAPMIINDIFAALRRLNSDHGQSILLVEQNARAALRLAHRACVLTNGSVTRTGTGAALLDDADIVSAFLGKSKNVNAHPVDRRAAAG